MNNAIFKFLSGLPKALEDELKGKLVLAALEVPSLYRLCTD
jgi:hypothetical protein